MKNQPCEKNSTRKISLPARFRSLDKVRNFVARAAKECGLESAAIYAVELAVDEAFTNIIEHAYRGESNEKVECTCQIFSDHLKVILRDCGNPFNPLEVPEPDLDASLEERTAGGLGLFFMRNMMDEVDFQFIPGTLKSGGCNILTMIKRRERAS